MSKCLCWPKKSKYIKEVLGDRGECFVFWHRVSRGGEGRGRKEEIVAPGSRKEEKEERERGRNFIAFLRLGEKKEEEEEEDQTSLHQTAGGGRRKRRNPPPKDTSKKYIH